MKDAPPQQDPRDTYRVAATSTMNPTHTVTGTIQLGSTPSPPMPIIRATALPDSTPLPPRNWKVQGNMWPIIQKAPAQYLDRVTSSGEICPAMNMANSTAKTALRASLRMTAAVRGPPNTR